MITKRDMNILAKWISENTDPRTADRLMCLQFAREVCNESNPRFSSVLFNKALEYYDSYALGAEAEVRHIYSSERNGEG